MNSCLVTDTKLVYYQPIKQSFLGCFDGRIKEHQHPVFLRVNQLFEAWITCRQEIPRESWGEKKMRNDFLSLIRSEEFTRHVRAWTTEILLNICVHSTRYTRVQSLNRLNWESNSRRWLKIRDLSEMSRGGGGGGGQVETEGGAQLFETQKREGT